MKCGICGVEIKGELCENCTKKFINMPRQSGRSFNIIDFYMKMYNLSEKDLKLEEIEILESKGFKREYIVLLHDFYYNELNFCGCGSPSEIMEVIFILLKGDNFEQFGKLEYGVKTLVFNILDSLEYMDHGSSIGGAWLTEKGKSLYEALEALFKLEESDFDDICDLYEYIVGEDD